MRAGPRAAPPPTCCPAPHTPPRLPSPKVSPVPCTPAASPPPSRTAGRGPWGRGSLPPVHTDDIMNRH